jgi:hypothetical protein
VPELELELLTLTDCLACGWHAQGAGDVFVEIRTGTSEMAIGRCEAQNEE